MNKLNKNFNSKRFSVESMADPVCWNTCEWDCFNAHYGCGESTLVYYQSISDLRYPSRTIYVY